jgi:hypothetical protein
MSIDTAKCLTPPHSLQGQKLWGGVKVFGTIHGREGCACVQGCPPNVTSLGYFFYDHVSTGIVEQGDARSRDATTQPKLPPRRYDLSTRGRDALAQPCAHRAKTLPRCPLNVTFGET